MIQFVRPYECGTDFFSSVLHIEAGPNRVCNMLGDFVAIIVPQGKLSAIVYTNFLSQDQ